MKSSMFSGKGCKCLVWFHVTHGWVRSWGFVNTVMKLPFPLNAVCNSYSDKISDCFSGTLLRRVRYLIWNSSCLYCFMLEESGLRDFTVLTGHAFSHKLWRYSSRFDVYFTRKLTHVYSFKYAIPRKK